MAESVGMQIINQRCEDILRAMSIHELSLVDLARVKLRFEQIAILCYENIEKVQEDLKTEGGGDVII